MMRKRLLAWLFKVVPPLTVLLVLGGLATTVYELHRLNGSLDSLKGQGLWVQGGTVDVGEVRGTVNVEGDVDVGNTVEVEGRVSVDGTVEVTSCDTRFRGCDPIEVNVVDVWDTVDVRVVR